LTVRLLENLVGGPGPDEGMAAVVPADEGTDLDHQLADGGEGGTVDDLAFDDPPNQISTRLSHHPEVGGEVDLDAQVRRHGWQGITGPAGPTPANALARRSAHSSPGCVERSMVPFMGGAHSTR
jgi:hypothetical protein